VKTSSLGILSSISFFLFSYSSACFFGSFLGIAGAFPPFYFLASSIIFNSSSAFFSSSLSKI
jgi:hypothetical protein